MVQPSALQKFGLFSGMMEGQIENIIPLMELENFGPEEKIITEGISNDRIYFLLEGRVTITYRDVVIKQICEGSFFGELEALDIMPSAATVKTLSPVTAMSISNRALRAIYNMDVKTFSLIVMNMARDLSRRLRKQTEESFAALATVV